MSDVKCIVCSEPWDYYGIRHGDMLSWETKLFLKGAGCPCCEGIEPEEGLFEPKSISDVEFGDEDPMIRIIQFENVKKRPAWERPEPKVHWTCDGCGVQVITNPDDNELEYHVPSEAPAHQWYNSHPFHNGTPTKEPAHIFGEEKVCEFCLERCDECGAPITTMLEFGDVYDEGYAFEKDMYRGEYLCIDCFENQEPENEEEQ